MSFFCSIFAPEIIQDERSGPEFPGLPGLLGLPEFPEYLENIPAP